MGRDGSIAAARICQFPRDTSTVAVLQLQMLPETKKPARVDYYACVNGPHGLVFTCVLLHLPTIWFANSKRENASPPCCYLGRYSTFFLVRRLDLYTYFLVTFLPIFSCAPHFAWPKEISSSFFLSLLQTYLQGGNDWQPQYPVIVRPWHISGWPRDCNIARCIVALTHLLVDLFLQIPQHLFCRAFCHLYYLDSSQDERENYRSISKPFTTHSS